MKRATWNVCRSVVASSLVAPILVAYLYFGSCGPKKHGVVMSARAFGISVAAAWCSAS